MVEENLEIQVINSEEDFELFWDMYHEYMNRDIFPNDELGLEITEEERGWFFSSEYRSHMHKLFLRDVDRAYPILFMREKELVGFCMYCTYHSEDGKCFIIDYCILPKFRNHNLGTKFLKMIKEVEISKGARYFELNVSNKRNMNFWLKQGFYFKGIDDFGTVILTTKEDEIVLIDINENNWTRLTSLKVSEQQQKYVASPLGILARAYVYRNYNARIFGIQKEKEVIGMLMFRDINEEPICYELQQFLIDNRYQNQGYGYKALKLILGYLYTERKYDNVEVCVKKEDAGAIHLYKKIGFIDMGYIDHNAEDAVNLIFSFKDFDVKIRENRGFIMN